jgi:hypothetical protein
MTFGLGRQTLTPWSYRQGVNPDPANKDCITAWPTNYRDALHSYGVRSVRELHDGG